MSLEQAIIQPLQDCTDRDLIARCCAGDQQAFALIYARYEGRVFRHAYYLLGHREDADDVKQETFLRAYRSLSRFRGEASLQTLLITISTNLCRDRMRQRRAHPISSIPLEEERERTEVWSEDPIAQIEQAYVAATIRRVLQQMPIQQRNLIVLSELEGYSHAEIAAFVGCTAAAVKLRLFRARRLLRERVNAVLNEQETRCSNR